MELLESYGRKYLVGVLFYMVWLTVQSVALFKYWYKVRPMRIRNPSVKSFHRLAVQQNKLDWC